MKQRLPLLLLALLVGCEQAPLDRSCGGERVQLCGPSEWALVTSASLEPSGLRIADFDQRAQIRVVLARCDGAPAAHEVDISALVPGDSPDAGGEIRITPLLTISDGADGDPTPGDGIIEVDVPNPFIATVPANTDMSLRFVARSTTPGGCTSGSAEIDYRTGAPRDP